MKSFLGDFVTLVVPERAGELRLEAAKFLDKESFVDVRDGRRSELDLVAEVPTRGSGPRLVLVHVEIEGEFRRAKEDRLWRYYMHLRLAHRLPVLPILLALKGGPPGVARRTVVDRLGGLEVATFAYWAWGLRGSVADDWVGRSPLASALAGLMRTRDGDRAMQKHRCLAGIGRAGLDEARECLLVDIVETYLKLNQTERRRYAETLAAAPEVSAMDTWAEKLERKGRAEGARAVVRRLLEQRFGEVPEVAVRRLEKVKDVAELERLVDRALAAGSLGELGLVG